MKKSNPIEIKTVGEPTLEHLSESEQKTFYITLLMRILELRRQQLEEQHSSEHEGGDADGV